LVANSRQHQTQEVTMGPAAMGFHKTNMGWAHRRLPRDAGLQLYRESRQRINDWIRKCHPHVRVKKSKTYCFLTGLMLRCNVCVCLTKLGEDGQRNCCRQHRKPFVNNARNGAVFARVGHDDGYCRLHW
jgi:hypothetical protein